MELAVLQNVAGPVSRETHDELRRFMALFAKWNERINLTARSTDTDMWQRHIIDSAQLMPLAPAALRWLDVGSGGGFPGLVVAFLLKARPGGHIHLVESNRKKAGFLQAMIGEFNLPAHVNACRIEDVAVAPGAVDLVTARALAPLAKLLELTEPWLEWSQAKALFHKGREYRQEVAECADKWAFDLIDHASLASADGVILEITDLRRRTP